MNKQMNEQTEGVTISIAAKKNILKNYEDFKLAVSQELGETHVEILDASLDENIDTFAQELSNKGVKLNGFLHAIAMDKTIRKKEVKPLLDVTKDEFCDTMNVSAYSLIRLSHYLLKYDVLQNIMLTPNCGLTLSFHSKR